MRYHHGDLRRVLLDALPRAIALHGLERLSLRALARQAGVSHGAPAHHFSDKQGLLTAFAIEGSQHLERLVSDALTLPAATDHVARLSAVSLGYLEFALQYPAHFCVSFRPELLNMADPALLRARTNAGNTLDLVLKDAQEAGLLTARDYPNVRMASWSLAHGYASIAADVMTGTPADALRRQARRTFDHYSRAVLQAADNG